MSRPVHAILASTIVVFGLGGCLAPPDGPAAAPSPDAGANGEAPPSGDQPPADASPTDQPDPDQPRCQPGSTIDLVYVAEYDHQDRGITAYALEGAAVVINTSDEPVVIDSSEVLETRHDGMLETMVVTVAGESVMIPPGYAYGDVHEDVSSLVSALVSEPVELVDPSMTLNYTTRWVDEQESDSESDGDAVVDIGGYVFDLDFDFEGDWNGTRPVAARRVTGTCTP